MKLKRITGQEVVSVCHLIVLFMLMSGFRKPRFSLFLDTSSVGGSPLS